MQKCVNLDFVFMIQSLKQRHLDMDVRILSRSVSMLLPSPHELFRVPEPDYYPTCIYTQ